MANPHTIQFLHTSKSGLGEVDKTELPERSIPDKPFIREITVFLREADQYVGSIFLPFPEIVLLEFLKKYFLEYLNTDPLFFGVYSLKKEHLEELKKLFAVPVTFDVSRFEYFIEATDATNIISAAQAAFQYHKESN